MKIEDTKESAIDRAKSSLDKAAALCTELIQDLSRPGTFEQALAQSETDANLMRAATLAERERCAKIVEQESIGCDPFCCGDLAKAIAAAIRRGE